MMLRSSVVVLAVFLSAANANADGFDVSPSDGTALEGVLKQLDTLHRTPAWCEEDCVTFLEMHFGGSLQRGELTFEINGVTTSSYPSFASLFGASVSLGIDNAQGAGGKAVSLFWADDNYSTVLPVGEFTIKGTGHFKAGSPITLHIPGPTGLVSFSVADADIVGSEHRRGVKDATFTLSPMVKASAEDKSHGQQRLRLQVERHFMLGREREFDVDVQASGAKVGQVIVLPVLPDEIIQALPPTAHVRTTGDVRTLEWVAGDPAPSLHYSGKWKSERIALRAGDGALNESWSVTCDDPYQCNFKGNAEARVGTTEHIWDPLAGQTLDVELQRLDSHAGIDTVAQAVHLTSRSTGRSLLQTLEITWSASTSDLMTIALPQGADVSVLRLGDQAMPILKNAAGEMQVSIPGGGSLLHAEWELPTPSTFGFLRMPMPRISAPAGSLFFNYEPDDAHLVLQAGGLAGSPRIDLWPNLVVVLLTAIALAWGCRAAGQPLASQPLWIAAALGFCIFHPGALLPLVISLILGRWLSRVTRVRKPVFLYVELGAWLLCTLTALSFAAVALQHALFETQPFDITLFVSGGTLAWGTYVAGEIPAMGELPAPWALTIPLSLERWLWAAWAVAFVMFALRESRNTLAQASKYWAAATKPAT